uniref:Uncharacterized protein n=1 Tax=Oryza sativa subsp. japonica TaxID=39947 RepID=Q6ER29_ORYSJ|nr:hypothetical protein [Oryza sativa Japonica Group]
MARAPFSCYTYPPVPSPSPSTSQGEGCQHQIWRYLGPPRHWIRLSHVSDEVMIAPAPVASTSMSCHRGGCRSM